MGVGRAGFNSKRSCSGISSNDGCLAQNLSIAELESFKDGAAKLKPKLLRSRKDVRGMCE